MFIGPQNRRRVPGLRKKTVHRSEMLDFGLWFKIQVLSLFRYGEAYIPADNCP